MGKYLKVNTKIFVGFCPPYPLSGAPLVSNKNDCETSVLKNLNV